MNRPRGAIDGHIGNRIRFLRMHKGLSQKELGSRVGVDREMIDCWEHGEERASAECLFALAHALKEPIRSFFDDLVEGGDMPEMRSSEDTSTADEALELLRAFSQITDPQARKVLVRLARSYAAGDALRP